MNETTNTPNTNQNQQATTANQPAVNSNGTSPQTPPTANATPNTTLNASPPQQSNGNFIRRADSIIYLVLGIIESLMVFRVIFKLLGANPNNAFISFIYSLTDPFLTPFRGIFGFAAETSFIEASVIVAMIVYALFAVGLSKLFRILKSS